MSDNLTSMNIVISKQARDKLRVIMEKLELSNVHVGVERAIELAYEAIGKETVQT